MSRIFFPKSHRSSRAALLMIAIMATLSSGCWKKEAAVHFKVEAKTNQGDPVDQALVVLDGKTLGKTNELGLFEGEAKLPVGARKRLEVKKESDAYYFAPYYETFSAPDSHALDMEIAATLYFVPKPTVKDEKLAATGTSSPAPDVAASSAADAKSEEKSAESAVVSTAQPADAAVPDAPTPIAAAEVGHDSATLAIEDPTPAKAEPPTKLPADVKSALKESAAPTTTAARAASETDAQDDAVSDELDALTDPKAAKASANPLAEASSLAPAPKLNPLAIDGGAPQKGAVYPKPDRPNKGAILFTVHVFAGEQPLAEAQVLLGQENEGDLKVACTTNARGRCAIRFAEKPEGAVTFVAVKPGYKTKSVTAAVADKEMLKIDLERGQTIDVFAVTKSYNYTAGLKDVEVFVGGKRVGVTDRFGRLSYVYDGKADDLVTVSLKPRGFLPEVAESDFVASGPMKLVRTFTPEQPPAVRMTVLGAAPTGKVDVQTAAALQGPLDEAIRSAARKHLFSSAAFKEYPASLLERAAQHLHRSVNDMLRLGWHDTELKATLDAMLLPTVITGDKPALELSVVDGSGRVLAAAKEDLDSLADKASVDRAVAVLAKKITRAFPFEGAVMGREGDKVTINLGYGAGRGVKAGDVLDVYGTQAQKKGLVQEQKNVARLVVKEVFDTTAKCSVSGLAQRSTIDRGDLVTLKPRRAPEATGAQIRVTGAAKGGVNSQIAQANVYFNDQWIGATDETGRLYLDATGSGTLKVIRHGFQDFAKPFSLSAQSRLDVSLSRETAFLRVDSKPQGLTVKIEGKVIGKTPLASPIAVPAGFVKIELDAPSGFKSYSSVLELDQGTLDLSGVNAIALETDYLAIARRLAKEGKTEDALTQYDSIPKTHSDYLLGRQEAGEIYLTVLDEPAKAAEAFGIVTSDEAVKQFSDKRFIGSHIDEGIALFQTAEKLAADQPDAARAHYQKCIQVLEGVAPELRFVPTEQYAAAVHNVDFHRALARHKLWLISHDKGTLAEAVRTWRSYLDGSARSLPAEGASKGYVENAEVYYRQAMASQGAPRGVSAQ